MSREFVRVDKHMIYLAIWKGVVVIMLVGFVGYMCRWN